MAKRYTVEFKQAELKKIASYPKNDQRRLLEEAEVLATEPRPERCTKLTGSDNTYRIRVGNYRLIYEIYDNTLHVLIVRARRRNESTYRR